MVNNSVATLILLVIVIIGGIDHAIVLLLLPLVEVCFGGDCVVLILVLLLFSSRLLPCLLDKTKETLVYLEWPRAFLCGALGACRYRVNRRLLPRLGRCSFRAQSCVPLVLLEELISPPKVLLCFFVCITFLLTRKDGKRHSHLRPVVVPVGTSARHGSPSGH